METQEVGMKLESKTKSRIEIEPSKEKNLKSKSRQSIGDDVAMIGNPA